jgi:Protein of unknown function (DUF3575)
LSIKKYFAVFFLLNAYTNGIGQSLKSYFPEKKIVGRFNFTGLLDAYDENISIGAEYRFNAHWSTGSDVAYIFKSIYLSESKDANGIILRPFIRYYPKKDNSGFLEAEIHYKYVAYQLTDWIGRDASNGVPAYEEYATFHYNKRVFGLNIKAGTDANLSRDKRLRLEVYLGLGIRFKMQGADIGTYIRQRGLFPELYNPQYSTLVLPLGMRLLCDIR